MNATSCLNEINVEKKPMVVDNLQRSEKKTRRGLLQRSGVGGTEEEVEPEFRCACSIQRSHSGDESDEGTGSQC